MEFSDLSRWFQNEPAYALDAQDGDDPLFLCRIEPFDDTLNDGLSMERRLMSIPNDTSGSVPASRMIRVADTAYALGRPMQDVFLGSPCRLKIVLHQCSNTMAWGNALDLLTPQGSSSTGAPRESGAFGQLWAHDTDGKDGSETTWSSATFYTGAGEDITTGDFLFPVNGTPWRVKKAYITPSDVLALDCEEVPADFLQDVQYVAQGFDKVLNRRAPAAPVTKRAIVLRWYQEYALRTQAQPKPKDGDVALRALPGWFPNLSVGDQFVLADASIVRVAAFYTMPDTSLWIHGTR